MKMSRDNFTPLFFATAVAVFFEALTVAIFHGDPDMHLFH